MVDKTFNGNGGSLTNGMNWTPPGVPAATDTAFMPSGSGILGGSNLNGATLDYGIPAPSDTNAPALTLWDARLDLDVYGFGGQAITAEDNSTLNIDFSNAAPPVGLTVDIAPYDTLNGTVGAVADHTLVVLGQSSVYNHTGSTDLETGGTAILDTNTLGIGDWILEFMSQLAVAGGFDQTVTSHGGFLNLETPTLFTGQVSMSSAEPTPVAPDVLLDNLVATGAKYDGQTLSILWGSQVIDRIHISDPDSFKVFQTSSGVNIWARDPTDPTINQGTLLLKT